MNSPERVLDHFRVAQMVFLEIVRVRTLEAGFVLSFPVTRLSTLSSSRHSELLDLIIADERWNGRRKELTRALYRSVPAHAKSISSFVCIGTSDYESHWRDTECAWEALGLTWQSSRRWIKVGGALRLYLWLAWHIASVRPPSMYLRFIAVSDDN
jgi:hypothetical protein